MAVDMFLKLGDVKGESVDDKHAGEIDILAWSWGLSQSGTMHQGGGGGSGKVNIQDISITKYVDKASPVIMQKCCSGKHFPDATIIVRKAGDKPLDYLKITLTDVLVTGVSTGASGSDDRLTENVTLNFAKVKMSYQAQKKSGDADGGAVEMGWDIEKNAELK